MDAWMLVAKREARLLGVVGQKRGFLVAQSSGICCYLGSPFSALKLSSLAGLSWDAVTSVGTALLSQMVSVGCLLALNRDVVSVFLRLDRITGKLGASCLESRVTLARELDKLGGIVACHAPVRPS